MSTFQIDSIIIGDRVRKDMGDLKTLAESMKHHGLLHPVVVKTDRTLVAGHRRLEAARLNGWTEIPVTVVDVDDLLSAERDENAERKNFTPTEAVEIGWQIEEQHRAKIAASRHDSAVRAGKASGAKRSGNNSPNQTVVPALGQTDVVASNAVGMAAGKYRQARAVVAAAESDPAKFGDLTEHMDATGNVSGAHQEMERRKGTPNGKKTRHPIFNRMAYPKPNREMERALPRLDGICECLEKLKPDELDASKRRAWAESLKKMASRINKVSRRIHV